jgi:hypothetical protein
MAVKGEGTLVLMIVIPWQGCFSFSSFPKYFRRRRPVITPALRGAILRHSVREISSFMISFVPP